MNCQFTQPLTQPLTQTSAQPMQSVQSVQQNPFANFQTNYLQTALQSSFQPNSQSGQFLFNFNQSSDNLPLIDKIKNLKLNGVVVYNEKEIATMFGEDVTGIDVCCVRGNQILAIKQDINSYGGSIKTLSHFVYSCLVIESKYGQILKIFVSNIPFDVPTIKSLERNNIKNTVNAQQSVLTTETANYVKSLYS